MGTIMAACMLLGVLFAARLPVLEALPRAIKVVAGVLVLMAGLWNVLWYAIQHLTEFWGFNALVSGLLMLCAAGLILVPARLPDVIRRSRPIILVLLLCYALLYGITIYRL